VARGNLRVRDVVMTIRRILARAVLLAEHALTVMADIPDFIRIGPVVLVLVGGAVGWAVGDVVVAIRPLLARAVLLAKHALTVMAGIPDFIRIGSVVLVLVGGAVGWAVGVVPGIIHEFVHVRRLCCENRIIDRALVKDKAIQELMGVNRGA